MKENKIGGIPIIDTDHKLVGILTTVTFVLKRTTTKSGHNND